jgi:hypothetical protein
VFPEWKEDSFPDDSKGVWEDMLFDFCSSFLSPDDSKEGICIPVATSSAF